MSLGEMSNKNYIPVEGLKRGRPLSSLRLSEPHAVPLLKEDQVHNMNDKLLGMREAYASSFLSQMHFSQS